MRSYSSFQYGTTLYGFGEYADIYVTDSMTFSDAVQPKADVLVGRCQDVVVFDGQYRTYGTTIARYNEAIEFTEDTRFNIGRDARYSSAIVFISDIRLKYISAQYTSSVQFAEQLQYAIVNAAYLSDSIQFSDHLHYVITIPTFAWDTITFDTQLYPRHNWEPLANPEDEIWIPKASAEDFWVPVVTSAAETWVPKVSVEDFWVPRVIPSDIWTPREQNNG